MEAPMLWPSIRIRRTSTARLANKRKSLFFSISSTRLPRATLPGALFSTGAARTAIIYSSRCPLSLSSSFFHPHPTSPSCPPALPYPSSFHLHHLPFLLPSFTVCIVVRIFWTIPSILPGMSLLPPPEFFYFGLPLIHRGTPVPLRLPVTSRDYVWQNNNGSSLLIPPGSVCRSLLLFPHSLLLSSLPLPCTVSNKMSNPVSSFRVGSS